MQQRAFFIWHVKARHMTTLLEARKKQEAKEKERRRQEEEENERAQHDRLSLSVSWFKKEMVRIVARPSLPKSPTYYVDEC